MKTMRQSAISLFGRVIPAAVGLGSVCIYTRLLDPASVGVYALLLSSSLLASGLGFAWLRNAVLRVMSGEADGRMEPSIAKTVVACFAITALIVGSLEGTLLHIFRPAIPLQSVVLAVGAGLALAWNELNASLLQARLRFLSWGVLNFARAVGALAATLAFIALGWKTDALLCGFIVGNCASLACVGLWSPALAGKFDRELFGRFLHFGWPLSVKGGFEQIAPTFQRYIIDYSVGASAVGLYAVANDFTAQTLGSIVGSLSLAGIPMAFRARDRGGAPALQAQLADNARLIFAMAAPLALGVMVLAKPIASVFFGPNFRAGAEVVMALIAAQALLGNLRSYYFDQAFELAYRTRPQAVISAIVAIVSVLSSFVLIPRYTAVGAALSAVIAGVVGISLSAIWGASILRVPIPMRSWLKTGAATIAMTAVLAVVPKHGGVVELLSLSCLGALVYGGASAAMRFDFVRATLRRRTTSLVRT